jgi:nucleotide-binding universal stress UspA family protein
MIKIKNILVATDFSAPSESALEYGRALSLNFGARLHVLHVVEVPVFSAGADGMAYDFALIQESMEEDARKKLTDLLGAENGQPPAMTRVVTTAPSPAIVIADYAKKANIDVIVMGTHGRGMLGHLFMGSVAERVVRIAPCPVLTLRNPEHEFVFPDALQAVAAAKK